MNKIYRIWRNPIWQYVLRNTVIVIHKSQASLPKILVFQIKTSIYNATCCVTTTKYALKG